MAAMNDLEVAEVAKKIMRRADEVVKAGHGEARLTIKVADHKIVMIEDGVTIKQKMVES